MTRSVLLLSSLLAVSAIAAGACTEDGATRRPIKGVHRTTTDPETGKELPDYNDPRVTEKEGLPVYDALRSLKQGDEQTNDPGARSDVSSDNSDTFNAVTNAFCKEKKKPGNLRELQDAIGLTWKDRTARGSNGANDNPGFAFLANSSSLVARSVSAINPRAFIFLAAPGRAVEVPGFVVMTFARGEDFIEIAAVSPKTKKLSFYLVKFDLACGEEECKPKDSLTPEVENNWKHVTVYDDEDLKNSLLDCRHCHQPEGTSQPMMLRMQELQDPWTHWFRNDRPGGLTLTQDYFRAHGTDEDYAGVPGILISKSDGRALEDLVRGNGGEKQPNEFDTKAIEAEIKDSSEAQPEVNEPKGESPTWQANYDRAFQGDFIPVPYHDVKVTDPNKLQFVTNSYKEWKGNNSAELADIRRVFLTDALEDMTMLPKKGASGKEVLIQTCAQCHNPKLDQSITRAKFDVTKLDSMSREEKDLAIDRMVKKGTANRLHMPPANMRSLPDDARQAAVDYLSK